MSITVRPFQSVSLRDISTKKTAAVNLIKYLVVVSYVVAALAAVVAHAVKREVAPSSPSCRCTNCKENFGSWRLSARRTANRTLCIMKFALVHLLQRSENCWENGSAPIVVNVTVFFTQRRIRNVHYQQCAQVQSSSLLIIGVCQSY